MKFDIGTILTVTTGRLLTKPDATGNGIDDLYKLLGHMTGESPFTHTLGRFAEECKPVLLEMFPELVEVDVDRLDLLLQSHKNTAVAIWKAYIRDGLRDYYDIPAGCVKGHASKNPITELAGMMK